MQKPPVSNDLGSTSQKVGPSPAVVSVVNKVVRSAVFSSVKTPGFRTMTKRNRSLVNNPFSQSFNTETRRSGTVVYGYFTGSNPSIADNVFSGDIGLDQSMTFAYPVLDTSFADSDARSKLLTRLKDASINLGQSFAERKQTVNLIATNVNRLASAAMAIRRGKFNHAASLFGVKGRPVKKDLPPSPKNLSNHWLEFSYGWRPLVNDIYGAAEAIAKTYGDIPKRTSVSAISYANPKKLSKFPSNNSNSTGVVLLSTERRAVRYTCFYAEDVTYSRAMAQTGLSNPLLLAWELVPYSFVIDWFLPLGTYLSNMDASNGLFFQQGTVASRSIVTHDSTLTKAMNPNYPDRHTVSGGGVFIRKESKSRSPLYAFPSPSFPSPKFEMNIWQVLSGLSLLTQAFKR